jgi:uncharacterized protein DUF397
MRVWSGMPATDLTGAKWRKSSASNPSGACVELAELAGEQVAVRNSRDKSGPALVYSRAAVAAFLRRIKNGEFDGLVGVLSPAGTCSLPSEDETFIDNSGETAGGSRETARGQATDAGVWLRRHPAAGHARPPAGRVLHCRCGNGETGPGWPRKR